MPLNWDVTKMIENGVNVWMKKEDGEYVNPVTDALINMTMTVGCDGEKIELFAKRVREFEIACGKILRKPQDIDNAICRNAIRQDTFTEGGFISLAELLRHKGMRTNASTMTDAQWNKKLSFWITEEADAQFRLEKKRAEVATGNTDT